MQSQRGWKPLVPPTLHAIILMPIEVVIGVPADEGVGGVIVHRHAWPVLQVFHALENGKGGDNREEKRKNRSAAGKTEETNKFPKDAP